MNHDMHDRDSNNHQHIVKTFSFLGLCNGQSRKRPTDRGGKNIFAFLCHSSYTLYNAGDGGDIKARYRGDKYLFKRNKPE